MGRNAADAYARMGDPLRVVSSVWVVQLAKARGLITDYREFIARYGNERGPTRW
jgi:hypothetical protein